jgi:hypothetical protein
MSTPISTLEQQRSALLQQISELGDFRPGSITGTEAGAAPHPVTATSPMIPAMLRTLALPLKWTARP